MSSLAYLPSSPTLFNSGTRHTQMSSCYLVDSPRDELDSIYARYQQVARLSKFAGGIGIAWSRVRSRGALIRGTNGQSNGIVPWLRTLDSSVAAVNQGGRRKGAACVYLEPWHPDIEEFLDLRDNTGEDARRTHNLNLANWIPDEFMRRVEADELWSLIDPDEVPELPDLWGDAFDEAYRAAEADGRFVRQVKARDLYGRMMRTLAQTGNGWLTFKDRSNRLCNQTARREQRRAPVEPVHRDRRGVLERRDRGVQPRLDQPRGAPVPATGIDWDRLRATVRTAVPVPRPGDRHQLLPVEPRLPASNPRWRPVGLGVMGLQDVFFALRPAVRLRRCPRAVDTNRRGDLPDRARGLRRARRGARAASSVRLDARRARRAAARPVGCGRHADTTGGTRCARGSQPPDCGTRCSSRSRRRRPSRRSPGATSASSRRCRTCSSARHCPASSCSSTPRSFARSRITQLVDGRRARRDQASRRIGAGHHRAASRGTRGATALRGSCRNARSSTWQRRAGRSSTRASR